MRKKEKLFVFARLATFSKVYTFGTKIYFKKEKRVIAKTYIYLVQKVFSKKEFLMLTLQGKNDN